MSGGPVGRSPKVKGTCVREAKEDGGRTRRRDISGPKFPLAVRNSLQARLHAQPAQRVAPSEDQTSILVRTRAITSLVNSLVEAWPPRSGVRTPAPTASRTDSYIAREALSASARPARAA